MKNRLLILLPWLLSVLLWTLYRKFFLIDEIIEELILKPLVFIFPVVVYLNFRESLALDALELRLKNKLSIGIWGIVFGIILSLEGIVGSLAKKRVFNLALLLPIPLVTNAIISVATATSEELLYRGFLLPRIEKIIPRKKLANLLVALMFGIHHLGIALFVFNYSGMQLFSYLLMIVITGYAYGFIYQKTKSVYASIVAHTLWNFSAVFFM